MLTQQAGPAKIRVFEWGRYFPGVQNAMIEWLILPALILVVVLAIVTARPKGDAARGEESGQSGQRDGKDKEI